MPISPNFIMNELKDFYKVYLPFKDHYLLEKEESSRNKNTKISNIKILAIMIMYHLPNPVISSSFINSTFQRELKTEAERGRRKKKSS